MFTEALKKRVLGSNLINLLTRSPGVDRYAELLAPTWTPGDAAAKGGVRWATADGATVALAPNDEFGNTVKAGQCVNLTVGIAAGKSLRFTRQCQGRRFEPRASYRTARRRAGIDVSM